MVVEVQVQANQPQHISAVIHQLIIVQSFLLEVMLHVNNITMVILICYLVIFIIRFDFA